MIISICGSMKFYQEMRESKEKLEAIGHTVFLPKGIDEEIPVEARTDLSVDQVIAAKIEYDFIREHFRCIEKSDAILVLNYEKNGVANYIGGNTFLEMGHAFGGNKKIFLLNPIPTMDYDTEMHAMEPVILNGDIKLIKN